MNNKKYSLYIFFTVLIYSLFFPKLCFSLANKKLEKLLTSKEKIWLTEHPVVRIAHDPDFPPIEFYDENEFKGIAVEYIRLIESELEIEFRAEYYQTWDEVLSGARSRKIDLLAAASPSPQRDEYLLSSHPHLIYPGVIITSKGIETDLTIEDLAHKKIAIVSGYVWQDFVKNDHPEIEIVPVKDIKTGLTEVSIGNVYGMIAYLPVALYTIEKEGIINLRVAGETGYFSRLSLLTRNDWPLLNSILNKVIELIDDKDRKAIQRKWINIERQPLFEKKEFWLILIGIFGFFGIVVGIIFVWNRILNTKVKLRTKELLDDIAQRVEMEEKLRESEKKYRELQSNIPIGVFRSTPEGKFVSVNPALVNILGYNTIDELLNVHIYDLYSDSVEREKVILKLKNTASVKDYEVLLHKKNGSAIWCSISSRAIKNKDNKILYFDGICEDITERKKAEELIRKNLKEKDILIKEIHHRVKNNMQIISSILRMQAHYIKDENYKKIFQVSQNRVRSMALLHEILYKSKDFTSIDFNEYVTDLTQTLIGIYKFQTNIVKIRIDIENIFLKIETSIPCGLIINELLTNSMKYAFPDNRPGTILISLSRKPNDRYLLIVQDDGIGYDGNLDIKNSETLGLTLVYALVEQINGKLELATENGMSFKIEFRDRETQNGNQDETR